MFCREKVKTSSYYHLSLSLSDSEFRSANDTIKLNYKIKFKSAIISRYENLTLFYGKEQKLTIAVLKVSLVFLVLSASAVADIVLVLHDGGQVGVVAGRRLGAGAYRQLMTLVLRRVWK